MKSEPIYCSGRQMKPSSAEVMSSGKTLVALMTMLIALDAVIRHV